MVKGKTKEYIIKDKTTEETVKIKRNHLSILVIIRIFFFRLVVAVCGKPPRTVQSRRSYIVLSGSYKPYIS
jgi:hypothetical protein